MTENLRPEEQEDGVPPTDWGGFRRAYWGIGGCLDTELEAFTPHAVETTGRQMSGTWGEMGMWEFSLQMSKPAARGAPWWT